MNHLLIQIIISLTPLAQISMKKSLANESENKVVKFKTLVW